MGFYLFQFNWQFNWLKYLRNVGGNGGANIRPVGSSEWTAKAASTLGFTAIEVYADRMIIQAIDTNDQVFDQGIIRL